MRDHPVMEVDDAVAAGPAEGERQQRVQKTGNAAQDHAQAEATGRTQVLQVGLADRGRVLREKLPHSHELSIGKAA